MDPLSCSDSGDAFLKSDFIPTYFLLLDLKPSHRPIPPSNQDFPYTAFGLVWTSTGSFLPIYSDSGPYLIPSVWLYVLDSNLGFTLITHGN